MSVSNQREKSLFKFAKHQRDGENDLDIEALENTRHSEPNADRFIRPQSHLVCRQRDGKPGRPSHACSPVR